MTARRLSRGGRIDRSKTLRLTFDGKELNAHPGDTLASALLASDEAIVGRSFKYHRPRGLYAAGVEEPNALVQLRRGARSEPNSRATSIEAFNGLEACGQNAWPSVRWDANAANQLIAPFINAGFYYKTFVGPFKGTGFWMFCEKFIRKAAGMGLPTTQGDPDTYEKVNAHCDVLVIGAGPAGLSAALAAGRSGARVILAEQDFELGGSLLSTPVGGEEDSWLRSIKAELERLDNVRILTRATVFGAYDQEVYGLVERAWDHVPTPPEHQPRQRYWQIRTKQAVMATGAIERPLVFGGNDKPGVMLAGASRSYLNRYAVLPGQRVVVATNNDSAYGVALDLARAGASVTLLDARVSAPTALETPLEEAGITLLTGHGILAAKGSRRVKAAAIAPIDREGRATGGTRTLPCDLIAISGGWSPVVHLWSQRQKKPVFNAEKACFVPLAEAIPAMKCAGDALAAEGIGEAVTQGFAAGADAARDAGLDGPAGEAPSAPSPRLGDNWGRDLRAVWAMTRADGTTLGKAFIDLQHDVSRDDVDLAHREGYVSVEHLKRYTTTGMATDQGKTSNINALARMAELSDRAIPQVGTTTFRPPYTPVAIGTITGHEQGRHFSPVRRTPLHDWHEANGAVMLETGAWMRPWYYPQTGESIRDAYIREIAHVRNHVGMVDVSTLGKIAVQGPDAAEFLNRVYVNGWKSLAVGRLRYGVMLREDGMVMDDGATARLGEHDYFMTTTTANAAKVLGFAEHLLQTAWTDLKVHVTSVTDQWAAIAVAGPKARDLLQSVVSDADLSREALPNNHFTKATIDGVPLRIHRMSYSGELAYELYIPSGYGQHVWNLLEEAGKAFDLRPYGLEAMGALRIEKGHVAGPELDGRTTLGDLGLKGFASKKKPFVGSVLRHRPGLNDPDRQALVGLEFEGDKGVQPGYLLFSEQGPAQGHGEGWVASTTYSPSLGKNIALAFLKNGPQRRGETVRAMDFVSDTTLHAKVVSHHFYDPQGERQNG